MELCLLNPIFQSQLFEHLPAAFSPPLYSLSSSFFIQVEGEAYLQMIEFYSEDPSPDWQTDCY